MRTSRTAARRLAAVSAALGVAALLPAAATPASAASAPPVIGVSLPSYHYDPGALTAYEKATGVDVTVLQTFISWQYSGQPSLSDFPTARARQFAALGAELEVTWDPANPALGTNQPSFSLASIAAGADDAYITRFAQQVRSFGRPVRLRFAHEMNGTWTPYSEANSGNRAGDFVKAWRHVHDVVAAAGAANVTWVWSPNILVAGGPSVASLYPGDAYVDEVGIDGYSYPLSGCPSPAKLFGPTVAAVRSVTTRPIRIAETGVATTCADRGQWISDFRAYLAANPDITGYTWWERTGDGRDYRVVGTPAVSTYTATFTSRPSPSR